MPADPYTAVPSSVNGGPLGSARGGGLSVGGAVNIGGGGGGGRRDGENNGRSRVAGNVSSGIADSGLPVGRGSVETGRASAGVDVGASAEPKRIASPRALTSLGPAAAAEIEAASNSTDANTAAARISAATQMKVRVRLLQILALCAMI
jgi:hypothetical protein